MRAPEILGYLPPEPDDVDWTKQDKEESKLCSGKWNRHGQMAFEGQKCTSDVEELVQR